MNMENEIVIRQNIDVTMCKSTLTARQTNILFCGISKIDIDPNKIKTDMNYISKFNRSDLPKYESKEELVNDINTLYDCSIIGVDNVLEFRPITAKGIYNNGSIILTYNGLFLKAFHDQIKGYSVFTLLEMFTLNGKAQKKLFEIFSAYKNRKNNRLKIELNKLFEIIGLSKSMIRQKKQTIEVVIKPAIKQINNKTSIKVDFKEEKNGRNRFAIFTIKNKNNAFKEPKNDIKKADNDKELTDKEKLCKKRMKDLLFSDRQINEILKQNKADFFNSWWFGRQPEINGGIWTKEDLRGNFYNTLKA